MKPENETETEKIKTEKPIATEKRARTELSVSVKVTEDCVDGIPCVIVENASPYSLSQTLECGQCFRFDKVADSEYQSEYTGVAMGKFIHIAQRADSSLVFFNIDKEEFFSTWFRYFSLDVGLEEIKNDILRNAPCGNLLYSAAECAKGIAILRQDAWEALFSFIVSQNNNIPRIRKIIRTICEAYGNRIENAHDLSGEAVYSFPSAEQIAAEPEKMDSAHVGFRLRYLTDAAVRVANGTINLSDVASMGDYDRAKQSLMQITGVGSKVADCTLLFGMNYLCAFPVDVWIKRSMPKYFDDNFTPASLGRYAGIAQQYIFYYSRLTEGEKTKK